MVFPKEGVWYLIKFIWTYNINLVNYFSFVLGSSLTKHVMRSDLEQIHWKGADIFLGELVLHDLNGLQHRCLGELLFPALLRRFLLPFALIWRFSCHFLDWLLLALRYWPSQFFSNSDGNSKRDAHFLELSVTGLHQGLWSIIPILLESSFTLKLLFLEGRKVLVWLADTLADVIKQLTYKISVLFHDIKIWIMKAIVLKWL